MKEKEVNKKTEVSSSTFDDLVIEETKTLEEGTYTGKIVDIKRDTSTFDYTRYFVKVDNQNITLQPSFPTKISFMNDGTPSSQHAKFLARVGLTNSDDVELGKFIMDLVNRKVRFLVAQKTNEQGTFSEIVKDSIKFI